MGKMKEVFIEQMNNQVGTGDEDYDYESYEYRAGLEALNASMKLKYSESDVKFVIENILGDANSLTEQIMHELNELYNLRNDF